MTPLVIEYVFEGHQRGYNFTSPTASFDETTLKAIWRQAMPRGQGWGAPYYQGVCSLKCFPLPGGRVALSEVVVTDQRDEHGRGGIRRAQVSVMARDECDSALRHRLASYPLDIQAQMERGPTIAQWKRIVDEALPKIRRSAQIVLAAPYSTANAWQAIEAFVINLALSRVLAPRRAGKVVPFTTLALDYRDESPLVALPAGHSAAAEHPSPILIDL